MYVNIDFAKYKSTWLVDIQYYLLAALIITVLIITFRFSSFKVWLISFIGSGILAILGSVFGISIDKGLVYTQFTPYIILLFFYVAFISITLYGLSNKKYKVLTGVTLNWFVATNIFIAIMMISLYSDIRHEIISLQSVGGKGNISMNEELKKIRRFSEIFLYINPFLYIICFYFIINLYKKWQAMPEE